MKKYHQSSNLQRLAIATAAIGLVTASLAQAENDATTDRTATDRTTTDRATTGRASTGRASTDRINGQTTSQNTSTKVQRTPLTTEVTSTFVDGYTVPDQYRTHFTDLPPIEGKNVVVRYHKGRAYYVNSNDWKIVRVVDLDSSVKLDKDDAAFVEGYVIPDGSRTRFVEVPNPDANLRVRYYNNTAYYMDPSYRIVRTVRLSR